MSAALPRVSPPKDLITMVRERHGLQTFVETGTYQGKTAMWASQHFARVVTIENAQGLYEQTITQFGSAANVEFLLGDTRAKLREIVPVLASPAVFWLDAHWSGAETYGEQDECPIVDEVAIINASAQEHIILIDDARLFLSPPPPPHDATQWPDISTLLRALTQGAQERYVVIYGDVIAAVPLHMKAELVAFYQEQITRQVSSPVPAPTFFSRVRARLFPGR